MPPAVGATVRMSQRKWPDRPHWAYDMTVLGADRRGTWAAVRRGTPARKAGGPIRELPSFVVLVPAADPWIVECYLGHPKVVTYINIGTVPKLAGGQVIQVDLDLDVVLRQDGSVVVEDRDEFRANSGNYPGDLAELAEHATSRAVSLLEGTSDPFGARSWLMKLAESEQQ